MLKSEFAPIPVQRKIIRGSGDTAHHLAWTAMLSQRFKIFPAMEPLLSVVLSFGGIYFMWSSLLWMGYRVILSDFLTAPSFCILVIIVLYQLI